MGFMFYSGEIRKKHKLWLKFYTLLIVRSFATAEEAVKHRAISSFEAP